MPNPFLNRPVIHEGNLTFIWNTNVGPNDYELSADDDSIIFHAPSTGFTMKFEHARIGEPRADGPFAKEIIEEGYKGVYSLNGARGLVL